MPLPRILLLSLGGTITMTRAAGGGISPSLSAADLIENIPALAELARLEALTPRRLPSASLGLDDLIEVARLLNARLGQFDGAVVVQGTDTLEESAFVLDLLVSAEAPVVLTGAMRGAAAPGADGPANLLAAVTVAASAQARGQGVLVCLNDQVHAARFVQKTHTALPSAFASPQAGPLAILAEGRPLFHARVNRYPALNLPKPQVDAPVALIKMGLGDDGRLLAALPGLGFRGCVIEGMGAGHVGEGVVPRLEELAAQLPVVLSSRVAAGPVFTRTYGYPGSEIDLLARGLLPGGRLGGLKARLLLALLLRCGLARPALAEKFREYADA